MTIGEVLDPVALPVAFVFSALSVLWLVWHVARRYPAAPKRVPTGIRADGRPGRLGTKRVLWLAPALIAFGLAAAGAGFVIYRPAPEQHLLLALLVLLIGEVAWFAGWSTDRQIELARKMTYRIPPSRTLRALLPVMITAIVLVFVAARP